MYMVGGAFLNLFRQNLYSQRISRYDMVYSISKRGKISPSLILNIIGFLVSVLGAALVSVTINPVVEIVGGVIVAVGIALIALSKHVG